MLDKPAFDGVVTRICCIDEDFTRLSLLRSIPDFQDASVGENSISAIYMRKQGKSKKTAFLV